MIVEFLDKLAVPGIEGVMRFDIGDGNKYFDIKFIGADQKFRIHMHPDMDDDTFICMVKKGLEECSKVKSNSTPKKFRADDARVYDPKKDTSGLGVVPWAVVANNRLEELSRAVNAKMALLRESAMTDAERLEAFRQLAVWARELDLTVKLVLEMLKTSKQEEIK